MLKLNQYIHVVTERIVDSHFNTMAMCFTFKMCS